ncbi:DUF6673 family protein [Clostridium cellulovorans]|uniref:DUF6673 domain-containing protein n=1 Tax=Clostridium cellulovorans (strain ATCC 35296 / DSM 3052 / OCM 3 / 743B) TaxID=573061 RepID=D9SW00_CLOC7|nr:DUF6673 family protein [Clostridium cellulovorans]ADL53211.1 hypothetical protein Clocel_3535 [Clostridium cellulovorans 743B]
MKINNVELIDLDIFDVDVAEKYENALKKIENIAAEVKNLGMADSIRKQCNAIFNVFNTLFGEGTDKKIFGDKVNLLVCIKAFEELVVQVNEQKKELDNIANKYSPNRAQRRNK